MGYTALAFLNRNGRRRRGTCRLYSHYNTSSLTCCGGGCHLTNHCLYSLGWFQVPWTLHASHCGLVHDIQLRATPFYTIQHSPLLSSLLLAARLQWRMQATCCFVVRLSWQFLLPAAAMRWQNNLNARRRLKQRYRLPVCILQLAFEQKKEKNNFMAYYS